MTSADDQQRQNHRFHVLVRVDGDELIATKLRGQLIRELRDVPNVELTELTHDYELTLVVTRVPESHLVAVSYIFASSPQVEDLSEIAVYKVLECPQPAQDYIMAVTKNSIIVIYHRVEVFPYDRMADKSEEWIAEIDTEFFEPIRQLLGRLR